MTTTAKVILNSISLDNKQLITLQLRYPRFIHSEFMTHRVFSRNASSSRAVPVERLIKAIIDDTAMPSYWGKNKPGMSADEECNELIPIDDPSSMALTHEQMWLVARDKAISIAQQFAAAGYHKQIVNRLLEPFSHINVVVSATEWENFFALRCHPDAQPEIQELANAIKEAISNSKPELVKHGYWHLPYIIDDDWYNVVDYLKSGLCEGMEVYNAKIEYLIKCSVARCARVSYMTHDMKVPTIEEDLKLYNRLVGSQPIHASPCEHQATPDKRFNNEYEWAKPEKHGNFIGWIQNRKILESCQ